MSAMGPLEVGGHEFQRLTVQVDVGGVQFKGAPDPGEQRDHDDAQDEERRDPEPFGPFEDVGDRGVDEHHGDDAEADGALALLRRRAESVTATAAEVISTSTPVAYAPPWASTSASKSQVTRNPISGEHEHQRTDGPGPSGRHAVPGQVPGHEVQQAGHRGRAGEPQDGDGADVVDGAEAVAQVFVGQEGQGAAVRLAAGLELLLPGSAPRW